MLLARFLSKLFKKDGIILQEQNPEDSSSSLVMVKGMLKRLFTKDQAWRKYWHEKYPTLIKM